ncbi:MAG: glycerol kinase GlpK [Acidimicrobiia bacterium]|nr:glycerol kinase GlpK [Acidimicrobiia bacterium]MYC45171.1 glycerol kinase GlpK [Acidimicrobiia bacterium]MYI19961.1 glycerol kinase GlpK [Acidimicrobiia bacterium]
MTAVLAIDAGTTSVRTIAFDEGARPFAMSRREFTQHFPAPGWVEHDASEIWDAAQATLADVTAQLDEPPAAIGVTNQRETVVRWSRSRSEPLERAIVWQDRRTAARCAELTDDGLLPLVRERTGLVLDPYFSASKLEWLLQNSAVPTNSDLAVGTIDSWIIWNLTGGVVHATDATNASRTMLFDIGALAWSSELCALFGVPRDALPDVRPSSGDFGVTAPGAACGAGVPIRGVAGDQQAALFGQAAFRPGDAKNTYGTGSFVLMNVGSAPPEPVEGLLTTVAWLLEGPTDPDPTYALEGAIFATGATVQWLRDGLDIIEDASELEALAAQCSSTGGVFLVPAFAGLGSPYWDPHARGTIVGLTRGTGRPEIARAAIEAMVYQTRDVIEAMTAGTGAELRSLRVDGGASAMDSMLQLQADHLGVPIRRPKLQETTALGAAYLAGLAADVWPSTTEIAELWQLDLAVEPSASRATVDAAYADWKRAVERSRSWTSSQRTPTSS